MNEEITTSWHSYPKIYAIGHRYLQDFLHDEVIVEEKVDGSQFSFGLFSDGYRAKSKSQQLILDAPEKMFTEAVEVVQSLPLKEGFTYRAEYLKKPKHNCLAYDRIPTNHLVIFDINDGHESYLSYEDKAEEAARLGLEVVPLLYHGKVSFVEELKGLLDNNSFLGGQLIEGFVIKNYARFGQDGKALLGKFVSEKFKEKHVKEWKKGNPNKGDIIAQLIETYKCEPRWHKAVSHLRDAGLLDGSPKDIGSLMKEVGKDVHDECADEIKEVLFKWAWPNIQRAITSGLPQWYKEQLLENQFKGE